MLFHLAVTLTSAINPQSYKEACYLLSLSRIILVYFISSDSGIVKVCDITVLDLHFLVLYLKSVQYNSKTSLIPRRGGMWPGNEAIIRLIIIISIVFSCIYEQENINTGYFLCS